ncbi:transposase domain-containing protein [Sulfobacillus thermosulfidooxidans]|uniref:transposase domain-containing protein n=1 Tax=Sulfobacillus thermosulfidooxidans TaxID=28034 RepID=UPI003BFA362A
MMSSERTVEQWAAEVARLERQIAELQQRVQWYEEQFRLAKHRQFGASQERSDAHQLHLFNEAETLAGSPMDAAKKPSRIRARKRRRDSANCLSSSARRAHYLHLQRVTGSVTPVTAPCMR